MQIKLRLIRIWMMGFLIYSLAMICSVMADDPPQHASDHPHFDDIYNALGEAGLDKNCTYGRDQILAICDRLRDQNPEWFEGLDYGPIKVGTENPSTGHFGVGFYMSDAEGSTYAEKLENSGEVIEYTNWASDYTGNFQTRPYSRWKSGKWGLWGLQGQPDTDGKVTQEHHFWQVNKDLGEMVEFDEWYWHPDGPKYPTPDTVAEIKSQDPESETSKPGETGVSYDPNEKVGPSGYGPLRYTSGLDSMGYLVFFENIGTAPAQIVVIEDKLDLAHHDVSTLTLEAIAFGELRFPLILPPGETDLDLLLDLRPQQDLIVQVQTRFDESMGVLIWEFRSIDPDTFDLPDYDGFLPPNTAPPQGEGHVKYSIEMKPGLASGTIINSGATARIIFDDNAPIETNEWINTLDFTAPESRVAVLAAHQTAEAFEVSWGGSDGGLSGIKDYDIFVSIDEGAYIKWLSKTVETVSTFLGKNGSEYRFYAVARDYLGNVETAPEQADAQTRVSFSDQDGDGVSDEVDNCPNTPNPDQTDNNGNGIGDACEIRTGDLDKDGQICRSDIILLIRYRNQPSSELPAADLDGDKRITVLDARKLVLLCDMPRCACAD